MEERDRTRGCGEGKKEREIAVLNARRRTDRREEGGGAAARRLADFVGVLDKFSAIGSFDADSPSASPPTCVQIEGFRKSCDIPPRRRGKDRENARNEEQTDRRAGREERERFRRDGKVRGGTEGEGGGEEWNGAVRERLSA